MPTDARTQVAIVDYSLGNLYSVKNACAIAGLEATVTSSRTVILSADAVILPGVGAYGDAMRTLHALDLVSVIRDYFATGRPLVGICLGLQLLMAESHEFGRHRGLGIIDGEVVRLPDVRDGGQLLKVPQIGWKGIQRVPTPTSGADPWRGTLLDGISDDERMYFVHSYIVQPADPRLILSTTSHGDGHYCSSVRHRNLFACQFHPERSGPRGLAIYQNLAARISDIRKESSIESAT